MIPFLIADVGNIAGGYFTQFIIKRGVPIPKARMIAVNLSAGLMAVGLSFSLVFQALINMAVAVNLFPVTGQPLPLVSMGGTSIWFTCIAIGIILSVSRANEEVTTKEQEVITE